MISSQALPQTLYISWSVTYLKHFLFVARGIKNNVSAVLIKNLVEQWMDNMPNDKIANWVTGSHDISRIASRVSDDFVDHMNMLVLMLPGFKESIL